MNQRAGVAILMLSGLICSVGTDKSVQAQIHPEVDATWVLAHVDVETTGLVAGYHEMVDIGVAYTDLEGKILKTWYRKMMPQHLERVTEGAVAINGFDPAIWQKEGALSQVQALEEMLAFEKQHFAGRKILRVAYNCSFDSAFLDHWFRGQDREWRNLYSYGFLDIPSMAWALGYRDLRSQPLTRTLKVPDEPHTPLEHTGITGRRSTCASIRRCWPSVPHEGRELGPTRDGGKREAHLREDEGRAAALVSAANPV